MALEDPVTIGAYVDAMASLLELQLSAESREGVIAALGGILRLGASFSDAPLAAGDEPLPVVRL